MYLSVCMHVCVHGVFIDVVIVADCCDGTDEYDTDAQCTNYCK